MRVSLCRYCSRELSYSIFKIQDPGRVHAEEVVGRGLSGSVSHQRERYRSASLSLTSGRPTARGVQVIVSLVSKSSSLKSLVFVPAYASLLDSGLLVDPSFGCSHPGRRVEATCSNLWSGGDMSAFLLWPVCCCKSDR